MSMIERVRERFSNNQIQEITGNEKIITISYLTQSQQLQMWQVVNVIQKSNDLKPEQYEKKKESLCQSIRERLQATQMMSGSFCTLVLLDEESKKKLEETLQEPYIVSPQQFFFVEWEKNDTQGVDLYMQVEFVGSLETISKYKTLNETEVVQMGIQITKSLIQLQQIKEGFVGVTPQSICLTQEGVWKLQDKSVDLHRKDNKFKNQFFEAPEEIRGTQSQKSDIYRLGRILQILSKDIPISYHLKNVLGIACRNNANERYKTLNHFFSALEDGYKTYQEEQKKKEKEKEELQTLLPFYKNNIKNLTYELHKEQQTLQEIKKKLMEAETNLQKKEEQLQQKEKQLKEVEEKKNTLEKKVEEKDKEIAMIKLQMGVVQLESKKKDEKIASLETQVKNQAKVIFGGNSMTSTTTTTSTTALAEALKYNAVASSHCDKNNYEEAFKWYKKSAELGNTYAQSWVGYMYQYGKGVTQNYAEAKKWYEKAANQGDDYSQNNLGEFYYYGRGVTKNYTEAIKWYEKAANQGNTSSQNSLGYMYKNGVGVTQNYAEAAKWYRKSAEKGNAHGQNALANLYYNGYGVAKNCEEAKKWYEKSANQGNINSQSWMGYMYEYGQGVTKNLTEAFKWYSKAAEKEDAYSQKKLGDMYRFGNGVSKNVANAKKWYQKAANQGNEDAKKALKEIK